MKKEKQMERIAEIEEEKRLDEELQNLIPNAFNRLISIKKSSQQYSREDAIAIKEEFKTQEFNDIHVFLNKEQKERILAITNSLGRTEATKFTGIAEQNIFRWRNGCQRKKGSGRRPIYPEFEKELVKYVKDKREQGMFKY